MPIDLDHETVLRARSGDYAAFESLVAEHGRRVYGAALRIVGRRHDAEGGVQQTFPRVVEHLDEFRGESSFRTWLLRIATNHALVLLRRRAARPTVPLADERLEEDSRGLPRPGFVAPWRESPEEIASRHETRQLLTEALDELDWKYSLVFVLRDIEGLSTEETAAALAISPANVKVRLLRARLLLRERLTRLFGEETGASIHGGERL
jgi:RNA polymerase sigma-70 factor, ECF subfamily